MEGGCQIFPILVESSSLKRNNFDSQIRLLNILSMKPSSCSGVRWWDDSIMPMVSEGMIVRLGKGEGGEKGY
jgi:hypothetical protein